MTQAVHSKLPEGVSADQAPSSINPPHHGEGVRAPWHALLRRSNGTLRAARCANCMRLPPIFLDARHLVHCPDAREQPAASTQQAACAQVRLAGCTRHPRKWLDEAEHRAGRAGMPLVTTKATPLSRSCSACSPCGGVTVMKVRRPEVPLYISKTLLSGLPALYLEQGARGRRGRGYFERSFTHTRRRSDDF